MAPTLVIIRGNSGSGKSSVAAEVRLRYGRGCALIGQDYLRRIVLRELGGVPDPVAPGLIMHTVRYALDHGYHAILEGILNSAGHGALLTDLIERHPGASHLFYLDVSFDETVRRHRTRPNSDAFTPEQMREWYVPHDVLGYPGEHVIPETSTFEETVAFIAQTLGLRPRG